MKLLLHQAVTILLITLTVGLFLGLLAARNGGTAFFLILLAAFYIYAQARRPRSWSAKQGPARHGTTAPSSSTGTHLHVVEEPFDADDERYDDAKRARRENKQVYRRFMDTSDLRRRTP